MDNNNNKHLADVKTSLAGLVDQRFITREDVMVAYLVDQYIVNLLEEDGVAYRGLSFRARLPLSLLVVKVTIDKDPFVCFVSGRTFLICLRIFFRRLAESSVEWRTDKYG